MGDRQGLGPGGQPVDDLVGFPRGKVAGFRIHHQHVAAGPGFAQVRLPVRRDPGGDALLGQLYAGIQRSGKIIRDD